MRTRIKFCGITRAADAAGAAALGVDAVGLVFVPGSPRFLDAHAAAMIRARLPPLIQAVALFRNADADAVRAVIGTVQPDLLQFHGEEPADFCERFRMRYVKAVPMKHGQPLAYWTERFASASALLLDAHAEGEMGGTGGVFDWQGLRLPDGKPCMLAGGLNDRNVAQAIRSLRPYAVDVSSGIESAPGIKDPERMRLFVAAVRQADGD